MGKITTRVRYRGTPMTGIVFHRVIHNGETWYTVQWDCDANIDPCPYRPEDLEPLAREDSQNLQIIKRAHAMDRKWWEDQMEQRGTVEEREHFRDGTFQRI